MPIVSVIIPCYNSSKYIIETLDSVYQQTYRNIEVVIIDDGSKDNSVEIIQNYISSKANFRLIIQENTGQSIARSNAVEKSNGEFLFFLDSDDKIEKTYIQKCIEAFEKDSNLGIVYAKAKYFDAKNSEWKLPEFNIKKFLLGNSIHISALIKREDFLKVGGFDKNLTFYEDWDLFISIIKLGRKAHRINEFLFFYRQRKEKNSITNLGKENADTHSKNILKILNKHTDFYTENNIFLHDVLLLNKYKEKYYNIWYRKYFYKFIKPEKYKKLYD